MARFRNNEQQIVVEPIYRQDGLKVERVQRFDQTSLVSEIDRWRSWSFRITLGGTRYISFHDRTYTLAPNTILWHSPLKEIVRTRCLPGTRSDVLMVTCSTSRWSQLVEQHPVFRERNAALLASYPERRLLALQLAPPQVLRQCIALSDAPKVGALTLERNCTLLLRYIAELRFDVDVQSQEHDRRRRVELAQGRMLACLTRPSSLRQIAAEIGVSPRQLQRDFLDFTGLTPMRYLNVVRMSEANRLLVETSIPIAEIAALLGYVSMTHFSAAFRQTYNCSPRQVRGVTG